MKKEVNNENVTSADMNSSVNDIKPSTEPTQAQPTTEPVIQPSVEPSLPVENNVPESSFTPQVSAENPNMNTMTQNGMNVGMQPTNTVAASGATAGGVAGIAGGIGAKIASIGIVPIVVAAVAIVLIVGGLTFSIASSTPKSVFKGAINKVYKEMKNTLKEYDKTQEKFGFAEKAMNFSGDLKFDSNIEGMESEDFKVSDYKLAFDIGVHPKEEQILVGGTVSGNGAELDAKLHLDGKNIYITSSVLDEPINISSLASEMGIDLGDMSEVFEAYETTTEIKTEDYDYLIKTFKDALIKTLDSKKMKKSSAKFEVDGKNVSAKKISYEIDEDVLTETIKSMCETLIEDDKFIDKISDISGIDKSDIKDGLKTLKSSANDIELDDSIIVNIYIKGLLNKVVGLSLEIDDKEYVSLYTNKGVTEFIVDNHEKDGEYSSKVKLVVTAVEGKKETEITAKYNGEKLGTATIRALDEKKIDFDFEINSEDKIGGTVYLTMEEKKNTISGEYKFKLENGDEYMQVSGNYKFESKDNLESVNSDDAVNIDEVDFDELKENITEKVEEDEFLSEVVGDTIDEIEEESLDLNSIGMVEVSESEAISKLSNKKATVLYVGKTYYSSYSAYEAYTILENLEDLQYELEFYSFYLPSSDATTKFFDKVKDVPSNCEVKEEEPTTDTETDTDGTTTENTEQVPNEDNVVAETPVTPTETCDEVPAIYLIKDGKAVKVIKGETTSSELEAALAEIGIE